MTHDQALETIRDLKPTMREALGRAVSGDDSRLRQHPATARALIRRNLVYVKQGSYYASYRRYGVLPAVCEAYWEWQAVATAEAMEA